MIEIDRISKSYGETLVVDDVTLNLPAGGIVAIIGPNGAGKSTLLSLIGRLIPADSGKIHVGGLDVATTKSDILARRLAILRQDNWSAARLTVGDLVGFGRYPHSHGRLKPEDHAAIERSLGYLGLEDLRDRFLDELSGGQRQRAYVAMVLCQDTDYILLDEPLNSLDMKHAVGMMRILRRAAGEFGKTIVVVLHDINFASCYADRIIAMRDGRIEREGAAEEIIRSEILSAIYDLPITVSEIDGQRICTYYAS